MEIYFPFQSSLNAYKRIIFHDEFPNIKLVSNDPVSDGMKNLAFVWKLKYNLWIIINIPDVCDGIKRKVIKKMNEK